MPSPASGPAPGKYARIERERRFLLAALPSTGPPASVREITDHYLTGTSLRLRHIRGPGGDRYKLTQKIPAAHPGPVQGLITNIYMSKAEHGRLVAALPGEPLSKTRHSWLTARHQVTYLRLPDFQPAVGRSPGAAGGP